MRASTEHSAARELPDHLDSHLRDWVEQNLLTAAEAKSIAAYEAARATPARIPAAAEIIGYLGAVLVLAAGAVVYGQRFDDLSDAVRIAVPAIVAGLALLAGIPLIRNPEPTFQRLGAVLWAASVGLVAVTLTVAIVADRIEAPDFSLFVIGVTSLVYASVLYTFTRHGAMQLMVFGAGAAAIVGAIIWVFPEDSDAAVTVTSIALLALGVGWALAGGIDRLEPRAEAIFLGSAVALFAPALLLGESTGGALALGIVVSAAFLAGSTWLRSTPALLLSGIALFGYLVGTIGHYLADSLGMPVALAMSGVVLIAIALLVSRLRKTTQAA